MAEAILANLAVMQHSRSGRVNIVLLVQGNQSGQEFFGALRRKEGLEIHLVQAQNGTMTRTCAVRDIRGKIQTNRPFAEWHSRLINTKHQAISNRRVLADLNSDILG